MCLRIKRSGRTAVTYLDIVTDFEELAVTRAELLPLPVYQPIPDELYEVRIREATKMERGL